MTGRRRLFAVVFVVCVLAAAGSWRWWLPFVGLLLEHYDPPRKADIAVVLAGDERGLRILTAGQLAREGYVPKVLVSGPSGMYGNYESDLAIAFAVKHGYPESLFIGAPNDARSTREEAAILVAQLRGMGVHSFLVVTSDFHTRRAARMFGRYVRTDLAFWVVASPDAEFRLDRWWQDREGQKAVILEWTKTVASWFGI